MYAEVTAGRGSKAGPPRRQDMTDDNDGTTEDEQGRELGDFDASVGLDAAGEERTSDMTDEEKSGHDVGLASDSDDEPEPSVHVDRGAKLRSKVKRGTGTRDQDVLVIKAFGRDAAEAVDEFDAALTEVEERGFATRLRELQAENGGDDA